MKRVITDWRLYVFGTLFLFNFIYAIGYSVPRDFPQGDIVTIPRGASLAAIAAKLEEERIVRSAVWWRAAVIALGGEHGLMAGDYSLRERQSGTTLAWRMVEGRHEIETVKITIPEGFTNEEIADLFDERFVNFDRAIFLGLAEEGYMFPDTYFIQVNITAGGAIDLFKNNFEERISTLETDFSRFHRTLKDLIIMASIIEAEVTDPEDKRVVSGILWERLRIGMALQVDPAPETYEVAGLPAKPINNPGLISIKAAMSPKESPYLYFLSGKDGKTYYARTLEEHIENIRKYR